VPQYPAHQILISRTSRNIPISILRDPKGVSHSGIVSHGYQPAVSF